MVATGCIAAARLQESCMHDPIRAWLRLLCTPYSTKRLWGRRRRRLQAWSASCAPSRSSSWLTTWFIISLTTSSTPSSSNRILPITAANSWCPPPTSTVPRQLELPPAAITSCIAETAAEISRRGRRVINIAGRHTWLTPGISIVRRRRFRTSIIARTLADATRPGRSASSWDRKIAISRGHVGATRRRAAMRPTRAMVVSLPGGRRASGGRTAAAAFGATIYRVTVTLCRIQTERWRPSIATSRLQRRSPRQPAAACCSSRRRPRWSRIIWWTRMIRKEITSSSHLMVPAVIQLGPGLTHRFAGWRNKPSRRSLRQARISTIFY